MQGQVGRTPNRMRSENSAESHAVCLVDDDPLVLSSLRHSLASDGVATCSVDKAETFLVRDDLAARPAAMQSGPVAFFIKPV